MDKVTTLKTRFSNNNTGAEELKVESLLGSYFQLIFFIFVMIFCTKLCYNLDLTTADAVLFRRACTAARQQQNGHQRELETCFTSFQVDLFTALHIVTVRMHLKLKKFELLPPKLILMFKLLPKFHHFASGQNVQF